MRPRTTLLLPCLALLGAMAAMVGALAGAPQALAASSEVKLEIAEHCYFAKWPCWNVEGNNPEDIREIQPFTIAQGGSISFKDNEAGYPTDVIWKDGMPPSCALGVPVTPPAKTGWSGTCTFVDAGEYEFESQELFNDGTFNYTKYEVVVEGIPTTRRRKNERKNQPKNRPRTNQRTNQRTGERTNQRTGERTSRERTLTTTVVPHRRQSHRHHLDDATGSVAGRHHGHPGRPADRTGHRGSRPSPSPAPRSSRWL